MSGFFDCHAELGSVPPAIGWKLLDSLFGQKTTLLIGAVVFMTLGLIGFDQTGSAAYMYGIACCTAIGAWRLAQTWSYRDARDRLSQAQWARRAVLGGWAAAAGWGGWSAVVLFEPNQSLVAVLIGAHAGMVGGGAARNCALRPVANGQVLIASVPMAVFCLLTGNVFLMGYAGLVGLHTMAALGLVRFLNERTRGLLLKEQETADLNEQLAAANRKLADLNRNLVTAALTDALTGVANRRAFNATLVREWQRAAREEMPLSLLLIDVDHFKKYNDRYGHLAGDECLRQVAAILAGVLRRPADFVARYGGEEFVMILPQTELPGAISLGATILSAFADHGLEHDDNDQGYVTVSVGAATTIPGHKVRLETLLRHADSALYQAKRKGRNCVQGPPGSFSADACPILCVTDREPPCRRNCSSKAKPAEPWEAASSAGVHAT